MVFVILSFLLVDYSLCLIHIKKDKIRIAELQVNNVILLDNAMGQNFYAAACI